MMPFEKSRATEFWLGGRAIDPDLMRGVSSGHISRWKRALQKQGGLTLVKALTVVRTNVRINDNDK